MSIEKVRQELSLLFSAKTRFLLAYSGGPDSTFALTQIVKLGFGHLIDAIHFDYCLRPESSDEAKLAKERCELLGVACKVVRLNPDTRPTSNLYEWTRTSRLEALTEECKKREYAGVIMGHHYDDALETLVIRSPKTSEGIEPYEGIGWLLPEQQINGLMIYRPFLSMTKSDILSYLDSHQIKYIQDPSNWNTERSRGNLRTLGIKPMSDFPLPDDYSNQARNHSAYAMISRFWGDEGRRLVVKPRQISIPIDMLKGRTPIAVREFVMNAAWVLTRDLILPPHGFGERILEETDFTFRLGEYAGLEIWKTPASIVLWKPFTLIYDSKPLSRNCTFEFHEQYFRLEHSHAAPIVPPFRREGRVAFFRIPEAGLIRRIPQRGDRIAIAHGRHKKISDLLNDKAVPPWLRSSSLVLAIPNTQEVIVIQLGWLGVLRVNQDYYIQPGNQHLVGRLTLLPFEAGNSK